MEKVHGKRSERKISQGGSRFKYNIPTCNILGVHIAAVNIDWTVKFLAGHINDLSGDYICVSNVHTTVMSYEDPSLCEIENSGVMAIPDGNPLHNITKMRGYKNTSRIAGPDLMDEIFKISEINGFRHYFFGSTEETLEKLYDKLTHYYPGLNIAGMYSPPFRTSTEEEDAAIVKLINDTNPDFLWVGLGAPKQEKWMAAHRGKVKGLMIGVGAGFDYYAENIKRAPMWMQKTSMEWFYRFLQEPTRLFTRYLRTNAKFIWLIMSGK